MLDLDAVLAALDRSDGWLQLTAPTGTGKSTSLALLPRRYPDRVPELWLTQPTIANVHALARRVGGDVGIGAAGVRTYGPRTPLKIMTAGHALNQLLRRTPASPPLVVVVDEAHDRGVPTVGLVTALRHTPGVQVVLASATADWPGPVYSAAAPAGWPCGEVVVPAVPPGSYPAAVQRCHDLLDRALAEHPQGCGGIVFLAGERCVRLFIQRARQRHRRLRFAAVHGGDAAARAIAGPPAHVYVATDAAETGVTLPKVRWVVDSGFHNRASEDPETGAVQLAPHRIDGSSATQRAGRANRCGAGTVYRAQPAATLAAPAPRSPGELLMLKLKLRRHQIPTDAVDALGPAPTAVRLGLLDANETLSATGCTAAGLPLRSPRTAAFLAQLVTAAPPPALEHRRQETLASWTETHRVVPATLATVLEHVLLLWAALGTGPMPTPAPDPTVRRVAGETLAVLTQPSLSPRGGGATYVLGATVYAVDRHRSLSRLPWLHRVAQAPTRIAAMQLFACRGRPPLLTGAIALARQTMVPRAPVVSSDDEW